MIEAVIFDWGGTLSSFADVEMETCGAWRRATWRRTGRTSWRPRSSRSKSASWAARGTDQQSIPTARAARHRLRRARPRRGRSAAGGGGHPSPRLVDAAHRPRPRRRRPVDRAARAGPQHRSPVEHPLAPRLPRALPRARRARRAIDVRCYTSEMARTKPHPTRVPHGARTTRRRRSGPCRLRRRPPYDDIFGAQAARHAGVLRPNSMCPATTSSPTPSSSPPRARPLVDKWIVRAAGLELKVIDLRGRPRRRARHAEPARPAQCVDRAHGARVPVVRWPNRRRRSRGACDRRHRRRTRILRRRRHARPSRHGRHAASTRRPRRRPTACRRRAGRRGQPRLRAHPHVPARPAQARDRSVNGPAAGVGFVLMCFADIRFAAAGAKLTTSFARLGLPAEHGVSWMLPRLIGTGPGRRPAVLEPGRAGRGGGRARPGEQGAPARRAARLHLDYARRIAAECAPSSLAVIKRQLYADLLGDLGPAAAVPAGDAGMIAGPDFAEGVARVHRAPAAPVRVVTAARPSGDRPIDAGGPLAVRRL